MFAISGEDEKQTKQDRAVMPFEETAIGMPELEGATKGTATVERGLNAFPAARASILAGGIYEAAKRCEAQYSSIHAPFPLEPPVVAGDLPSAIFSKFWRSETWKTMTKADKIMYIWRRLPGANYWCEPIPVERVPCCRSSRYLCVPSKSFDWSSAASLSAHRYFCFDGTDATTTNVKSTLNTLALTGALLFTVSVPLLTVFDYSDLVRYNAQLSSGNLLGCFTDAIFDPERLESRAPDGTVTSMFGGGAGALDPKCRREGHCAGDAGLLTVDPVGANASVVVAMFNTVAMLLSYDSLASGGPLKFAQWWRVVKWVVLLIFVVLFVAIIQLCQSAVAIYTSQGADPGTQTFCREHYLNPDNGWVWNATSGLFEGGGNCRSPPVDYF